MYINSYSFQFRFYTLYILHLLSGWLVQSILHLLPLSLLYMHTYHSLIDLQDCIELKDPRDETICKFSITLEDILSFATGAKSVPPVGFIPSPSILFEQSSFFPRANTCANILFLPLQVANDDNFMFYMSFGVCNTAGFGCVWSSVHFHW